MIVTVNTDASFHPTYKVGAYAFWIVCNQGKIMRSGELKKAKCSIDAEVRCIANALHCLQSAGFKGITRIIINTDCLNAVERIRGQQKANSPERLARNCLKRIRKENGVIGKPIHEFRHVKAHSGTDQARKWVNDWCDKAAKKIMRERVKEIKMETLTLDTGHD